MIFVHTLLLNLSLMEVSLITSLNPSRLQAGNWFRSIQLKSSGQISLRHWHVFDASVGNQCLTSRRRVLGQGKLILRCIWKSCGFIKQCWPRSDCANNDRWSISYLKIKCLRPRKLMLWCKWQSRGIKKSVQTLIIINFRLTCLIMKIARTLNHHNN